MNAAIFDAAFVVATHRRELVGRVRVDMGRQVCTRRRRLEEPDRRISVLGEFSEHRSRFGVQQIERRCQHLVLEGRVIGIA